MKKKNVFKWWGVVLILSMCSVHAEAQDLKSVLTGVAKAVIGNKATTAHSIVGTWTYQAPECQFESDQLPAKAGGEIAAKEVEEKIKRFKKPIKVAVMGCAINGPGEAREADFGIAGGVGGGLVFRKGKVIRSVPENELIDALMEEIEKFETEGEN